MEGQAVLEELREPTRRLRTEIPEAWAAFGQLHRAAVSDGALSARTKELIALAIAVVRGCDGCIASHAKAAARQGATRAEVSEALGVALLMSGGPASVHGPRALAAYDEFAGGAAGKWSGRRAAGGGLGSPTALPSREPEAAARGAG